MAKLESCSIDSFHTMEITITRMTTDPSETPSVSAKVVYMSGTHPMGEVSFGSIQGISDPVKKAAAELAQCVEEALLPKIGKKGSEQPEERPRGMFRGEF